MCWYYKNIEKREYKERKIQTHHKEKTQPWASAKTTYGKPQKKKS